jgi:uncharacterized protein YjbK
VSKPERRAGHARSSSEPEVQAGVEVELQYLVGSDEPPLVPIELAGVGLQSSRAVELVDVYFDTADLALRRAGCTLRVRSETGRPVRLMWKGPAVRTGDAKQREEREVQIDHVPTDGEGVRALLVQKELWDVVARTAPEVADHGLEVIGQLQNQRSVHCYRRGWHRFELAWDRLTYPVGPPEVRIEVEATSSSAVHLLERVDLELRRHFGDTLRRPRRGKVKELCARVGAARAAA